MGTRSLFALAVSLLGTESPVWANDGNGKDNYRWRVEGDWWFIHPRGDFGARSGNNYINFDEDSHFGNYSTFTGKVDWRFHRKHHFLLTVRFSRTVTTNRAVEFQGEAFDVCTITAKMKTFNFAPGYQ